MPERDPDRLLEEFEAITAQARRPDLISTRRSSAVRLTTAAVSATVLVALVAFAFAFRPSTIAPVAIPSTATSATGPETPAMPTTAPSASPVSTPKLLLQMTIYEFPSPATIREPPEFSLYSDGHAIWSEKLSNDRFELREAWLEPSAVERLMGDAVAALADAQTRYDDVEGVELSTTVFEIDTPELRKSVSVLAIEGGDDAPSAADRAKMRPLSDLLSNFGDSAMASAAEDVREFEPEAFLVELIDSPATEEIPPKIDWPWPSLTEADFAPTDGGDLRRVLQARDLAAVLPVADTEYLITTTPDGDRYVIYLTPLLAGDPRLDEVMSSPRPPPSPAGQVRKWRVDAASPLSSESTEVRILVSHLSCGAELDSVGLVYPPTIEYEPGSIVITARADLAFDPALCRDQMDVVVPKLVTLSEPIGSRVLVDGSSEPAALRWVEPEPDWLPLPSRTAPFPLDRAIGEPGICAGVGLDAVLLVDPSKELRAWIESRSGDRVEALVWPPGFFVDGDVIRDETGQIAHRTGQRVEGGCVGGDDSLSLYGQGWTVLE